MSNANTPYTAPTATTCSAVSGWPARTSSVSATVSSAPERRPGARTQRRVPRSTSGRNAQAEPTAQRTKKAMGMEYIQPAAAISATRARHAERLAHLPQRLRGVWQVDRRVDAAGQQRAAGEDHGEEDEQQRVTARERRDEAIGQPEQR